MKVNEFMEQEPKVKYIQINKHEPTKIDTQHENFEDLLICVKNDINVLLVGEAGSGTTGAHNVAKALDLNYASISVGAQTGKHEFFGFIDANGNFVETEFYKIFKNGGLFLIDELDAGNAGVLTSINSALANGSCAFACGMVEKHENFRIVATANTYGNGATLEFIGSNAIDGATLDRFTVIDWNIDEILELKLCKDTENATKIQRIRRALKSAKVRHIVSTRIFNSEKLIASGFSEEKAFKLTVWKGLNQDTVNQILRNL
jgi:MoxR-like ATPase